MTLRIVPGDPDDRQVRDLIAAHRSHAFAHTPPENVFALEADGLRAPDLEFYVARDGAALVGMGALRRLAGGDGEIKSVHVAEAARGKGHARAILGFLIDRARALKMPALWLETGSMLAYAPSRALYARAGFERCDAFGDYPQDPNSFFMTRRLDGGAHADR